MADQQISYIGLNTSLYNTLTAEQVELVERSIWLRRVGRYKEALEIYAGPLASASRLPIIVIEQGSVYLETRRYGALYRFVDSHLQAVVTDAGDRDVLDLPEWRLVAIMKAMVSVRHKGIVEPAVEELARMQQWLEDVPVSEYTDIQINCIWRYILAYIFVKHSVRLDIPQWELIPKPNTGQEPWSGLADLRRSLLERGMVRHVNGLFKVEINRTPISKRLEKWREFEIVPRLLPDARSRHQAQADLHLRRCEDFISLHQLDSAKQEVSACNEALDKLTDAPGTGPEDDEYDRLHLQIVCLDLTDDLQTKLIKAEKLLIRLEALEHPNYATCLDLAAETAKAIYEATGSQEQRAKFYELRRRHERLDELDQEDLVSLVGHQYDIFGPAMQDRVDVQKCLEWIDGFFSKYPDFAAPGAMSSLLTYKAILLNGLQRIEESKAAQEKAQEWSLKAGSISELYHPSYSNIIAPGQGAVGATPYDSEDDESGFSFGLKGISAIHDKVAGARIVVNAILSYAFCDLKADRIELAAFELLLGFDEEQRQAVQQDAETLLMQLNKSDTVNLFGLIFLPKAAYTPKMEYQMTAEDEVREAAALDDRYNAMHKWLSEPPKGQRNERLFSLLLLLEVRKQWLVDANLYDLRIKDFDRLLDLQENFPRMLKEFSQSWRGGWLSGKAWLHYTKFILLSDMDKGWTQVVLAQECVNLAIDALRESRQLVALAMMQRLYGMLSLLMIRRLQQGKDLMEDRQHGLGDAALSARISELRKSGIEAILETDRVFSASEQEASWEDGIDGVLKRTQVAQSQQSYLTVQYATQLVLVPYEATRQPTEEDANLVWELVQKFKARSLARAIGMFRPSPRGLVNRIMESSSRATYEKMLQLQAEIGEAETKDRFHLRRELDLLRTSMQKDAALRQLSDLREGTAFSFDELDTLAEQVQQPVVLVEWFWVPPFFDNPPKNTAKGHIILLTARAGQKVTIDMLSTDPLDLAHWIDGSLTAKNARGVSRLGDPIAQADFNRYCGSLIAPLARRTSQDELLLLCPTHELNKIPLHALSIDDEPLIQRNPVVYMHALSLLRSCRSAAEYAADARTPLNPLLFSGIEAGQTVHDGYYDAGRQSVRDIASRLREVPLIDESANKTEFSERATGSRLLHLHTHCNWNASDPLEHSLEFPLVSTEPLPKNSRTSKLEGAETVWPAAQECEVLSAREVFSMHLQQGSHVNLIACSAGALNLKPGDEPTGLVPALLYSGASSTVSTLWPIEDKAGADFSRAFFDSFIDQVKKADQGQSSSGAERANRVEDSQDLRWVDVAKAVQHAVCKLDPDLTEPLLAWAGFVLHGFWRCPITAADALCME